MNLGTAQVIRGDARHLPLADNTVDLVVTSPPYFALRSYQDGGEHYDGQIGSEPTPAEFVDALLEVTAECVRVLKPSGSLWVNLGDKYAGSSNGTLAHRAASRDRSARASGGNTTGVATKSLLGIPWRYALRCIDDLGLILRAEVIWSKPNGLPESVTDRVRRSHEQWFHFVQVPRYFSAVDEIREEYDAKTAARYAAGYGSRRELAGAQLSKNTDYYVDGLTTNPLGKLPGSVWTDDSGESLTRSVLSAVAAGALTVDEGERILWAQHERASWSTSTVPASAGNGSDGRTAEAMARPQTSVTDERTGRTESPTACSSDPSPTGSPSTTPAATSPVSTPTTSSPSPSQRTSDEHIPSETSAHAAIPWPTPTPSAPATGGSPNGAASATRTDRSDVGESVWSVPTEPLRVPPELGIDHFAAFPTDFPKRIIQGWSPAGVCVECGEGRRPVVETQPQPGLTGRLIETRRREPGHEQTTAIAAYIKQHREALGMSLRDVDEACGTNTAASWWEGRGAGIQLPGPATWRTLKVVLGLGDAWDHIMLDTYQRPSGRLTSGDAATTGRHRTGGSTGLTSSDLITGYACACPNVGECSAHGPGCSIHLCPGITYPADTTPAVVLDPFGGTGTTALVAKALGRHAVTVDMSADYCRLAEWRTNDRDQLAKVLGVAKAEQQDADQLDLFTYNPGGTA